jgi:rRNA processing protein Gar1
LSPLGDNKRRMDKIGTGFRTLGDKLIIKLSKVPETNVTVYTEEGDEIGKLVDIIGPVSEPMGVVTTQKHYELLGKFIYIKSKGKDATED